MLLVLTCILAAAAAAPTYDQRQEGDFNVQADVQNVVLLLIRPEKISTNFLDVFSKSAKRHHNEDAQQRSDIHAMDAFVEPSEPYKVEIISEGDKSKEADGRDVEVVIAGRRRLDAEPEPEQDEYMLLGATEGCGPDSVRDPVTLVCRFKSANVSPSTQAPEFATSA